MYFEIEALQAVTRKSDAQSTSDPKTASVPQTSTPPPSRQGANATPKSPELSAVAVLLRPSDHNFPVHSNQAHHSIRAVVAGASRAPSLGPLRTGSGHSKSKSLVGLTAAELFLTNKAHNKKMPFLLKSKSDTPYAHRSITGYL